MLLGKRRHLDRVIRDECRLYISAFAELTEDLIDQFTFTHRIIDFHVQFLANFANLLFIHSCQIVTGVLFDGSQHSDTLIGRFEIDDVVAYFYFGSTVYVQTDLFDHFFSKFHHPVVVFVGYIYLHTGEFWIVCTVHTFVTEVFTDLVYTFKTADNKAFQVKLTGDSHV